MILILGNENSGVDPGILELSDQVVHLPMLGLKESLKCLKRICYRCILDKVWATTSRYVGLINPPHAGENDDCISSRV